MKGVFHPWVLAGSVIVASVPGCRTGPTAVGAPVQHAPATEREESIVPTSSSVDLRAPARPDPGLADSGFVVGEPFPLLELPRLESGAPTSLAAFRGSKLIVHVFASW